MVIPITIGLTNATMTRTKIHFYKPSTKKQKLLKCWVPAISATLTS